MDNLEFLINSLLGKVINEAVLSFENRERSELGMERIYRYVSKASPEIRTALEAMRKEKYDEDNSK